MQTYKPDSVNADFTSVSPYHLSKPIITCWFYLPTLQQRRVALSRFNEY